MKSQVKVEAKAERRTMVVGGWRGDAVASALVPLALNFLVIACLVFSACGRGEHSNAATTPPQIAGSAAESHPRVETALVELGSGAHELSLAG
ncbi:MAG: hypothetical protein KJS98_18320, partial [Nitrospirae bacterium]|nr:hypothetical protein [Nitrospirota bacterium]